MFFSIIIPVFNAEQFLSSTIKSIIDQSFVDYEILLINDGSTDNSVRICKYWKDRDKRVKFINKANEGVSITRNLGIKLANGDYLLFVDADDMMNEETLFTLYDFIVNNKKRPEVILSNHARFDSKTKAINNVHCNYDISLVETSNRDELLKYLFDGSLKNFKCAIWSHVYRTDFVKSNNILFDRRLILSEDIDWFFNLLTNATHYSAIKKNIYLYRVDNQDSTTHQDYNYSKYESNNIFQTKWILFFKNSQDYSISKYFVMKYLARIYINYGVYIYNISAKTDRINAISLFYKNLHLIKDQKNITYRFIVLLKLFFGKNLFLYVINKLHKLKYKILRFL